jgi:hypothetical protein
MTLDSFELHRVNKGGIHVAAITINGEPLLDLVRRVEVPFVERELATRIAKGEDASELTRALVAGDYDPLPAPMLLWPSRELLDKPTGASGFTLDPNDPRRRKATVLGCTCGIIECWFLQVRIDVADDNVRWSDFNQFHRNWAYELGPFVFPRDRYEHEIKHAR